MDIAKMMQPATDLGTLFSAQEEKRRWRAERDNATARLELAITREACATLVSQHQPVASLGIDRDVLRVLLAYVRHGDDKRRDRELAELAKEPTT